MFKEVIFKFEKVINTENSLDCTKHIMYWKLPLHFTTPLDYYCPIPLQLKLLLKKTLTKEPYWVHHLYKTKVNITHINRRIFSYQTSYKDIVFHGFCVVSNKAYAALHLFTDR